MDASIESVAWYNITRVVTTRGELQWHSHSEDGPLWTAPIRLRPDRDRDAHAPWHAGLPEEFQLLCYIMIMIIVISILLFY